MTLEVENSLGLSSVLGHVGVDELDNIVTDGGGEDGGHGLGTNNLSSGSIRVNTHDRARSHLE